SEHNGTSSEHKAELDMQRNDDGCVLSDNIDAPLIDALDRLDAEFREKLEILAEEPRKRERMQKDRMQQVIITLCKGHYLTLNVLANLVKRSPDALRQQYLNGMVKSRQIQLAFPTKPTHEKQAYKAHAGGQDEE
ncbi:RNA-binding domain-containing protein, partial [Pseudomonas lundensis]